MSEQRLRTIYTALLTVSLCHCIPAMAQETQPVKPAPPIHLRTGRQAHMPVTVENKCPQQESFSVTTDGLPASLVRAPQPISVGANSSAPSHLIVDTRNVDPGLYSGNIVIACVTCGTECAQDREVFSLQFQIDMDESATAPKEGQGTSKPEGESMLVIDEPAPSEAGKGQQPGTKPSSGAPQENPGAPGTQPGQALADNNPPAGPEKPPGGVGPAAPHGAGFPHAPPQKKPETGESPQPPGGLGGNNGPAAPPGGGNPPASPGTGPGTGGPAQPPGGLGGNGPSVPLGGGNPPPPPPPGMGPDDGLPLPKIPPRRTATAPCPCEKICAEAVAAEQKAQQLLADYMRIEKLVEDYRTLVNHVRAYIEQDREIAQHYRDTGRPDLAAETDTTLKGLEKDQENYQKQLTEEETRASQAGDLYHNAAVAAAIARLKCDACVDQHPECPATIRTPGDTTENPPTTNPPGPTTTSGGGGTNPPPTQEKPKQPPGTTPGGDHDGHKPPENPAGGGGNGYGHNETAQCPQLHRGCIALVVSMMKNDATTQWFKQRRKENETDLKKFQEEMKKSKDGGPPWMKAHVKWLKEELQTGFPVDFASEFKNAGCKVFAPDPEPDLQAITFNPGETDAQRQKIKDHNEAEMYRLNGVVTNYRTAVATQQPEIAIEIVDAHGGAAEAKSYDGTDYERCGLWGPGYYTGTKNELFRASFHNGNYSAANKNVCSWFNIDLSCYGGLTPKVVDELDNYATSTCQKTSAIDCGLHAGWGADGSFSSGTAVAPCHFGDSLRNANLLRQLIDDHLANTPAAGSGVPAAGGAPDFQWLIDGLKRIERGGTAFYSDRGYAQDQPPIHSHFGYPSTAAGAPCTGGKCGK